VQIESGSGERKLPAVGRMVQTEVPDLYKTFRQDMLQEPVKELKNR
jgi:hypothetical protein